LGPPNPFPRYKTSALQVETVVKVIAINFPSHNNTMSSPNITKKPKVEPGQKTDPPKDNSQKDAEMGDSDDNGGGQEREDLPDPDKPRESIEDDGHGNKGGKGDGDENAGGKESL
jgi:hypothetical protein